MPNPNVLDYSQQAVRTRMEVQIFDKNGNVINTAIKKRTSAKSEVIFEDVEIDGFLSICCKLIATNEVIWSTSNNPDAAANENNTEYKGMNNVYDIAEDIFAAFYNF